MIHNMSRRSCLSLLAIPGAGSLAGISAVTGFDSDKQRPKVLSLESFRVSSADQMPRLHSYLERTLLPVLAEVHRGPKMLLEALVAPHTPQVLFLSAFASFDEMIEIRGKVASHPGIQRARAELESGAAVIEEAQSQILVATHDSLKFDLRPTSGETGVFELRSYRAPAWRDQPPAIISAALRRSGIHPIVNASTTAGEQLPRFTYLIPFASLAARQEAWTRFDSDSDWVGLQRESVVRFGSETKVTSASIYGVAPYSPVS
jgi:hypothetical protein